MSKLARRAILLCCLSAFPLALLSCVADPTEGKQAATVNEAVEEETETSTPGQEAETGTPATDEPAGTKYVFDTSVSSISFTGSKVTGTHSGGWSQYGGHVIVPGGDFTNAKVNVTIDMTSTFSDDADLTEKLKGPDFFDVEKFPESTFKSTSIVETSDAYNVSGNLTLHGVTKNLTFPAYVDLRPDRLVAEAEFSFNRKDFGIVYDGLADDAIREKVLILFYIEANAETE